MTEFTSSVAAAVEYQLHIIFCAAVEYHLASTDFIMAFRFSSFTDMFSFRSNDTSYSIFALLWQAEVTAGPASRLSPVVVAVTIALCRVSADRSTL